MRAIQMWLIAGLAITAGCSDQRVPSSIADESEVQPVPGDQGARRAAQERLARRVAKALRDPDFRAWVRSSLAGSPYREQKLPFARTLGLNGGRGLRALAAADSTDAASVGRDLETADRLEFYFPVPAHRAAWTGDEDILVATEVEDHEAPVAFDTRGRRVVLDPITPPSTPVLAVVPQELDFDAPQLATEVPCDTCTSGGTPIYPPGDQPPGSGTPLALHMTYFSVNKDFEGWLKGSPEYEVHVMAPVSKTDTTHYRTLYCTGEKSVNYWDNNNDTWRGDVVLMTGYQIDAYHQAFPNNNYSILALEDDDTQCEIKVEQDRSAALIAAVSQLYRDYKATKDTLGINGKTLTAARSAYAFFTAVANFFKTNDDMIGIAVANSVSGFYSPDAQWAWIGEGAGRFGWVGLALR